MTTTSAFLVRVSRELAAIIDRAIGERTIRYTLLVAVPSEDGGPDDVRVTTCGNATRQLTELMLTDQLMKLRLMPQLRVDVPK